jgi:hypothetical protein
MYNITTGVKLDVSGAPICDIYHLPSYKAIDIIHIQFLVSCLRQLFFLGSSQ